MKNTIRFIQFILLIAVSGFGVAASADVKIKTRQTMQGQTSEDTTYIKGKRQRTERADGAMVTIQQCDLRRDLTMMTDAKTYKVEKYEAAGATPLQSVTDKSQAGQTAKGGVINMTTTTKDTGERKQMFGYTARRIIQTVVYESSPDACTPMNMKMEIDAWYIDAKFDFDCPERTRYYMNLRTDADGGCTDKYNRKETGTAKTGYPVYTKTTMYDRGGKETYSYTSEVVEISNVALDAALFDVPAGYREVKDFSAAAGATQDDNETSANSSNRTTNVGANNGLNANMQNAGKNNVNLSAATGAKKPGVIRLGMTTTKAGAVGENVDAAELAAAVQNTLAAYIKAPDLELVALEADSPAAIDREAKQKECDFVVYSVVSHKKGGGGFGKMFGKALGNMIPVGGSTGAVIAGQVASTVIMAASMSATTKAKDEITLEYKLQAPGGALAAGTILKAKAKQNGEDIITPLIEQAAQAIIGAAGRS